MIEKTLARMRTVEQCFAEIKSLDPQSCISKWVIYQLAKENKVRHFRSGTRFYIDLDDLIEFFHTGIKKEE